MDLKYKKMLYLLFSRYYLQGVAEVEGPQLLNIMQELSNSNKKLTNKEDAKLVGDNLDKGIFHLKQHLEQVEEDQSIKGQAVYDYNRLFVGPDKRLAPPYQSVYSNPRRLLMQEQTLQVKKVYQELGLQSKNKGSMPEDHLGLQLEFVAYLLHLIEESITKNQPQLEEQLLNKYQEFFTNHIYSWAFEHCREVTERSTTNFNKAIAYLLTAILTMEKEGVL